MKPYNTLNRTLFRVLIAAGLCTSMTAFAEAPTTLQNFSSRYEVASQPHIVKDKNTQLIWMRCSLGQTWNNNSCVGEPKSFDFRDATNEIKQLNYTKHAHDDGFTDWRMPTIEELQTLVFCEEGFGDSKATIPTSNGQTKELSNHCKGDAFLRPTVDPVTFPNASKYWVWSSSADAENVANVWGINFSSGSMGTYNKHHATAVRPVRTRIAPPPAPVAAESTMETPQAQNPDGTVAPPVPQAPTQ